MTNGNETPQDEYDEILRKLEILLSRHQSPSSTPLANGGDGPTARSSHLSGTALQQPRPGVNIPTLTQVVHSAPSTLSPADITTLLEQILDTALNDAGIDLTLEARKAMVQALKSRLFGL